MTTYTDNDITELIDEWWAATTQVRKAIRQHAYEKWCDIKRMVEEIPDPRETPDGAAPFNRLDHVIEKLDNRCFITDESFRTALMGAWKNIGLPPLHEDYWTDITYGALSQEDLTEITMTFWDGE